MSSSRSSVLFARWLSATVYVFAAAYVLLFVYVACRRMGFPYALQWLEGPCLQLADRALRGEAIYTAPSLEFVTPIYTPLSFYLGALFSKVLGSGFFPLRLLSFLSALGCFGLLFAMVRRETGCSRCGLVAAGLYASWFGLANFRYDLSHVDSLFLVLFLASAAALRRSSSLAGAAFAGLLGVLAFLTKQTAIPMIAALALYGFLVGRGASRWAYGATATLGIVVATVLFDRATDGWFWFYVFEIPGQGTMIKTPWWVLRFWTRDVPSVVIAFGASIYWLVRRLQRLEIDDVSFFGLLLGAVLASSWSARIHAGGNTNVLMPFFAGLAIGAALALHDALHGRPATAGDRAAPRRRAVAASLGLAQLLIVLYDPRGQIPTAADVAAGDRIVDSIRRVEGDVWVVYHPYLATFAGKPVFLHLERINNLPPGTPERRQIEADIDAAVRSQRFAAIVTDRRRDRFARSRLPAPLEEFYELREQLVEGDAFWPFNGLPTRPVDLYLPRRAREDQPPS